MSTSTEKPSVTPGLFARIAKTFGQMLRRTDPIVQEHLHKKIMEEPPKPAAEEPSSPPEKTAAELLLEQAMNEMLTGAAPKTIHIVYTEDQLAAVDLRLPRPKAEYINGLSKLHGVSAGSIINGLLERTPMGELTHIAITLRDAQREHAKEQAAKLTQTTKQPQGDQP
jgi:hypothetical protein